MTRPRSTLIALALCAPLTVYGQEGATRTWTDSSGEFTVEAELLGVAGDAVRLRRSDSRVIAVPINRLSMEDRRYLEAHRQSGGELVSDDQLAELNRQMRGDLTPDQNVAVAFWKAVGVEAIDGEIRGKYLRLLGVSAQDFAGSPRIATWQEHLRERRLPAGEVNPMATAHVGELEPWLLRNRESLDQVVAALDGEAFYSPYVNYPSESGVAQAALPQALIARHVARALLLRGEFNEKRGATADAISDILACYRLGRMLASGSAHVVEYNVGMALDALASRSLIQFAESDAQPEDIERVIRDAVRALPTIPSAADVLRRGPRAELVDWPLQIRDRGPGGIFALINAVMINSGKDKAAPPANLPPAWTPESRAKWTAAAQLMAGQVEPYAQAAARPTEEAALDQVAALDERLDGTRDGNPFARMLMNHDPAGFATMLRTGQLPMAVTPEDLAEGIAAIMMHDVSPMVEWEWNAKRRQAKLLRLLSD